MTQLTPRRLQVLELVRLGRTNDQIAAELGVSLAAVKKHVSKAMSYYGAESRTAVATAYGQERKPRTPRAERQGETLGLA
jgi:DNA-binding NarL/FixJ family response regulator